MLKTRGDLAKASREDSVLYNAMALRVIVKDNPAIRQRYHELLVDEMQEKGLHIAERILKMAELQEAAFGGTYLNPDTGKEEPIPADPKTVIDISKEISRLIAEGKGQPMSSKQTVLIASKEDVEEILTGFLES